MNQDIADDAVDRLAIADEDAWHTAEIGNDQVERGAASPAPTSQPGR